MTKACTRCNGDLVLEEAGEAYKCLQCGRTGITTVDPDLNPCKCGCGILVKGMFKQGHHMRVPDVKRDENGRYVTA